MPVPIHVSLPAVRPPPAPLHGGPLALLRFMRAHGMLTPKYAWLIALLLRRKFLSTYGRRLKLDGLAFIPHGVVIQIGRARAGRAGALVVARARHEDPLSRGRRLDWREDRPRPGVHDLRLPARLDRARVRDRRPGDADRLRPRDRRGRPADPAPGHLQARRARGAQRLDRLRGVHPARRDGGRQRGDRNATRWSRRTCRRTRSWAACPRASCGCATSRARCASSNGKGPAIIAGPFTVAAWFVSRCGGRGNLGCDLGGSLNVSCWRAPRLGPPTPSPCRAPARGRRSRRCRRPPRPRPPARGARSDRAQA